MATCTGTAALRALYAAAGIGPGDEVIVVALTFHVTAVPPLIHCRCPARNPVAGGTAPVSDSSHRRGVAQPGQSSGLQTR
ncbi:DegT/DnrJ/EryC1/StrS family aminotransferase [Streptomyces griseocarneus]|uniref:DegT/DnrJ/EryC1/StrS family aminotransferase n=1 Tax=Streptomyces griseocarneus TaxID=51201 RepID=UPI001E588EF9|nr:DegT/DnrJ/EryC1/StrS family aminotransferase [Streptomyces griseocarneus]